MSTYSKIGAFIVILALTSYSIGIITEQRKKKILANVLIFLTLGVILDLTATIFMIVGSSKGLITIHGLLGYSSFLMMFTDTLWLWRMKGKLGMNADTPKALHRFSLIAYLWWVAAFITGGLLVALR